MYAMIFDVKLTLDLISKVKPINEKIKLVTAVAKANMTTYNPENKTVLIRLNFRNINMKIKRNGMPKIALRP